MYQQYCKHCHTVSAFRLYKDWTIYGSMLHAEGLADTRLHDCLLSLLILGSVIWKCYVGNEAALESACRYFQFINNSQLHQTASLVFACRVWLIQRLVTVHRSYCLILVAFLKMQIKQKALL